MSIVFSILCLIIVLFLEFPLVLISCYHIFDWLVGYLVDQSNQSQQFMYSVYFSLYWLIKSQMIFLANQNEVFEYYCLLSHWIALEKAEWQEIVIYYNIFLKIELCHLLLYTVTLANGFKYVMFFMYLSLKSSHIMKSVLLFIICLCLC